MAQNTIKPLTFMMEQDASSGAIINARCLLENFSVHFDALNTPHLGHGNLFKASTQKISYYQLFILPSVDISLLGRILGDVKQSVTRTGSELTFFSIIIRLFFASFVTLFGL